MPLRHEHIAFRFIVAVVAVSGTVVPLAGCDRDDAAPPISHAEAPVAATRPMLWQRISDDAMAVAVDDAEVIDRLADATREAHSTLDDARQRWAIAAPQQRSLWAVKWAAPLASASNETSSGVSQATSPATSPAHALPNADVEHVWVQPVHWSPFRIEGILVSTPTAPLACGRSAGDLIAFPVDELSDWIHFASADPAAAFEGGYTIRVLEAHYGREQ